LNPPKKVKKLGRPKLPKGHAKARIVPIRFKVDDLRLINMAAKTKKQSVSAWVRGIVNEKLHA
jgi:uncharacterized protein (DUF1778 family)